LTIAGRRKTAYSHAAPDRFGAIGEGSNMNHGLRAALLALLSLQLTACGGGSDGNGTRDTTANQEAVVSASAALPQRAAGSLHRFSWPAAEQAASTDGTPCRVDIELQLQPSRSTVVVAAGLPDSGQHVIAIPHAVGEAAQVVVTNSCTSATWKSEAEFRIAPSQALERYAWQQVSQSASFPPSDGAGALVFNQRMWRIGGWNPLDPTLFPRITSNAVWSSADGETWFEEKRNTYGFDPATPVPDWQGRHTAGYAILNDKMLIMGGDGTSGHYQYEAWSSSSGREWTLQGNDAAGPLNRRLLFYTFTHRDNACIFGGQTVPQMVADEQVFYADIWCTADLRTWSKIADAQTTPPARGMIMGEAVLKGEVWILGGGTYHTPGHSARKYNDVWKSADLKQWTQVSKAAPWEPRAYHNVAVFKERLWVIAGAVSDGGEQAADTWYSADGYNWYALPTPWRGRHAASVFVHLDSLWLVGGGLPEGEGLVTNDVWRLIK
jgi:hypothetical protein